MPLLRELEEKLAAMDETIREFKAILRVHFESNGPEKYEADLRDALKNRRPTPPAED